MKNFHAIGRLFFATAMIASGLLQILRHDFVRLVPKLPAWIPSPQAWAVAGGLALVAIGLAIVIDWHRRAVAVGLSALFLVVLLLYVPEVWSKPGALFMWGNPCKTLALLSGAWLIAVMPPPVDSPAGWPTLGHARLFCVVCFGLFLVICGVMHFVYVDFVVQMVPAWMPGRSFWAYFTGLALLSGGIGIGLRLTARAAAQLSGLMIFLWVVMLHLPRAFASWPDAGEVAAIFEALALSGTAFLLAATLPQQASTPPLPQVV